MVIVGVRESEVESALDEGSGPDLPDGARCPACGGELGRWGSYRRWARRREETRRLRIARAICRACGRTHALLPSFLYARRIDLAELILGALSWPPRAAATAPSQPAPGSPRRLRGAGCGGRGTSPRGAAPASVPWQSSWARSRRARLRPPAPSRRSPRRSRWPTGPRRSASGRPRRPAEPPFRPQRAGAFCSPTRTAPSRPPRAP